MKKILAHSTLTLRMLPLRPIQYTQPKEWSWREDLDKLGVRIMKALNKR
jgi:hypothetical protein